MKDMVNDFNVMPYTTALIIGIFTGSSHCLIGCAPFISTYVMGTGKRMSDGLRSYMLFALGRIVTYTTLGIISSSAGRTINLKSHGLFIALSGGFLLILGMILCLKMTSQGRECEKITAAAECPGHGIAFNSSAHLFVAGIIFGGMPCPPLLAMMTYSLQLKAALTGCIVMLLFGVGTMISPLIAIAGLAGSFAKKIKEKAPKGNIFFQRVAGVILIIMGAYTLLLGT